MKYVIIGFMNAILLGFFLGAFVYSSTTEPTYYIGLVSSSIYLALVIQPIREIMSKKIERKEVENEKRSN